MYLCTCDNICICICIDAPMLLQPKRAHTDGWLGWIDGWVATDRYADD